MIYICIPAHNEAQTIGVLLWKIRRVMADFPRDYHIIVLDDASTDATAEVLEPYARVVPLTVLRSEKPSGYAGAVEKLLREATRVSTHPKRDVVVTMQGDFTESPEDIPGLIRKIEGGADVVGSVSAVHGTEPQSRGMRWTRRGLPWLLPRSAIPKEIRDPLSGFRAYRVNAVRRALQERDGAPLVRSDGWAANVELLLAVLPHARRADQSEVSVRYDRRERASRFQPWATVRAVWDLARRTPRGLVMQAAAPAGSAAAAPSAPSASTPAAPAASTWVRSAPATAPAPRREAVDADEGAEAPAERPARPPRQRRPRKKPAAAVATEAGDSTVEASAPAP
ncbi:MAG TPA: glycosyltransferase family 2 protein, partial [Longimicrobiaceae bacterium]|nr:glycosyltransferase family 2 protein [Longimicrobiaceae bacterium]